MRGGSFQSGRRKGVKGEFRRPPGVGRQPDSLRLAQAAPADQRSPEPDASRAEGTWACGPGENEGSRGAETGSFQRNEQSLYSAWLSTNVLQAPTPLNWQWGGIWGRVATPNVLSETIRFPPCWPRGLDVRSGQCRLPLLITIGVVIGESERRAVWKYCARESGPEPVQTRSLLCVHSLRYVSATTRNVIRLSPFSSA